MANLAENLSRIRIQQGLSRRDLARRSGVSLTMIQKIETGARIGQLDTLQKLFDCLGYKILLFPKDLVHLGLDIN